MRTGDERYLPARDQGKVKRFVRDYVDARICMAEFLLPLLIVIMLSQAISPAFANGLWSATILLVVLDTAFMVFRLRREVRRRFPDESHKGVVRYGLSSAGDVLDRSVLFDMTEAPGEDAIDGIKVDVEGNLYVCGPGGIWVISPAGERLDLIELSEAPHNLAFGGSDSRDLYVTALTSVYRLRTELPGITPFTERSTG